MWQLPFGQSAGFGIHGPRHGLSVCGADGPWVNAGERGLTQTLTADQLQIWWKGLNTRYFNNRLSPINILWSARLTASAGMFASRCGPRSIPRTPYSPSDHRVIRLSRPLLLNQPVCEVFKTLAHEVIHQWQFDIRKRKPDHGPDFRSMMGLMNHDGLGITIHHALDESVETLTRYRWHCLTCGRIYRRHRRTIRPSQHLCGVCEGPLKEI